MKYKKVLLTVILLVILFSIFGFHTYISFNRKGLDQQILGPDEYSFRDDRDSTQKVSEPEHEVVQRNGLFLSKIYLIERAGHYQIRFRFGNRIPFMHPELLNDTYWIVEDSAGNSYTSNMTVYAEQISGLNCVNVTLELDGEEFLNLAEKELNITIICSKEREIQPDIKDSYAFCQVKISCNN